MNRSKQRPRDCAKADKNHSPIELLKEKENSQLLNSVTFGFHILFKENLLQAVLTHSFRVGSEKTFCSKNWAERSMRRKTIKWNLRPVPVGEERQGGSVRVRVTDDHLKLVQR